MGDKEYFSHAYLNASTLKMFSGPDSRYSKRQALHRLQTPRKPSPAMALGSLFHQAMEVGYIDASPAPYAEFRTKDAKAWKEQQEELGRPILTQKDIGTAKMMMESVKLMAPEVWDLARSQMTLAEREVYNHDHKLKCKEDLFDPTTGAIHDWKTCKAITPCDIRKAIDFFDYDLQAAHYLMTDQDATSFNFLFVQSEAPFEVVIVPAQSVIDRGMRKWDRAFLRYQHRMEGVLEATTIDPSWDDQMPEDEDVEL